MWRLSSFSDMKPNDQKKKMQFLRYKSKEKKQKLRLLSGSSKVPRKGKKISGEWFLIFGYHLKKKKNLGKKKGRY